VERCKIAWVALGAHGRKANNERVGKAVLDWKDGARLRAHVSPARMSSSDTCDFQLDIICVCGCRRMLGWFGKLLGSSRPFLRWPLGARKDPAYGREVG
jgi:hypothetical protein